VQSGGGWAILAPVAWRFELAGDEPDLAWLATQFPNRPVEVHRDDTSYALEADAIDAIGGDDPVEHLAAAEEVLTRINGWAIAVDPSQRRVRLSGKLTGPNGQVHAVAGAGTGEVRLRGHAAGVVVGGVPQALPPGPRIVEAAETDLAIADILTLIGSHPHDFFTLYKVFEIIEHEARADLYRDWTTKAEAGRFTMSANSRAASGMAARHAIGKGTPKASPMTIEEARAYILRLAEQFLRSR